MAEPGEDNILVDQKEIEAELNESVHILELNDNTLELEEDKEDKDKDDDNNDNNNNNNNNDDGVDGEEKKIMIHKGEVSEKLMPEEMKKLVKHLKLQLKTEEEMSENEDFESLKKDYLHHLDESMPRLKYAGMLIRSKLYKHKSKGAKLLYELTENEDIDDDTMMIVYYYLAIVNYKLGLYSESERFSRIVLEKEPNNRQAKAFKFLLKERSKRKYIVVLDETEGSDYAFNRSLEMIKEDDELILVTHIDHNKVVESLPQDVNEYAIYSLKKKREEELAETVQLKYRRICAQRNIHYKYSCDTEDPRDFIVSIVKQEKVDTIIVPYGPPQEKRGFFSRITLSNLSDYLAQNAPCSVVIVKKEEN